MLKFSEAIRLGAMLRPQMKRKYFWAGNSCAIGAALEATGTMYDHNSQTYADVASERWPWLYETRDIACPHSGCRGHHHVSDDFGSYKVVPCVASLIVHLNDVHGWTRETIADWIATLEPTITEQETAHEHVAQ